MFSSSRVVTSCRIKSRPALFLPLAHLRENNKKRVVRKSTDLVIEGYWRCGNHFAVYAFLVAQPTAVDVAHHFHAPAQLMLAARWNVPALLLIREPVEAIASATVFLKHEDPGPLLQFYCLFHRPLVSHVDHFVVSDFPTTVGDFALAIDALNAKFGRSFARFTNSEAARAEVERRIHEEHQSNMGAVASQLPLPSAEKGQLKQRIVAKLREPRHSEALAEAQRLYEFFAARAVGADAQRCEVSNPCAS